MLHVLTVGDGPVLRASMARGFFLVEGMTMLAGESLGDATGHLDRGAPEIVISDIDMPPGDPKVEVSQTHLREMGHGEQGSLKA
ncbi:MAG: hypothetical protein OEZ06_10860 [Myxococcales bacterium]|nr:hypothetical protein [Myxococcales bacterium]